LQIAGRTVIQWWERTARVLLVKFGGSPLAHYVLHKGIMPITAYAVHMKGGIFLSMLSIFGRHAERSVA